MTSPDIPPQAITAAAHAIHEAGCGYVQCAQAGHPDISGADRDLAEAALEAAAPHLVAAERERCAQLVDDRAAEINGKGCGSEVEELWRLAALLREQP